MNRPSLDHPTLRNFPPLKRVGSVARRTPVRMFQRSIVLSLGPRTDAVASVRPSGDQARPRTDPCPGTIINVDVPSRRHSRTRPSHVPDASLRPSGDHARARTAHVCPRRIATRVPSRSQSRIVVSRVWNEPADDASSAPSGDQASRVTAGRPARSTTDGCTSRGAAGDVTGAAVEGDPAVSGADPPPQVHAAASSRTASAADARARV
jgi:hypothetical protein